MPIAPKFVPGDIAWFDATQLHSECKGYQGVTVASHSGVTKIIYTPYGSNQAPHGYLLAYEPSFPSASPTGPFNVPAAYKWTDLTQTVNSSAQGFLGGFVDDKGWFYLPPFMKNVSGQTEANGLFVRWNFTKGIDDGSAYQTFDINSMANPPGAIGWATGAYDGSRYVYFVPVCRFGTWQTHGWIVRYDTRGAFTQSSSWATFNLQASFGPQAAGFQSNAFIPPWLYLVPYGIGYTLLLRLDVTKAFDQPSSYQKVDLGGINPQARGYTGAVVKPPYLYLVPWRDLSKPTVRQSQSLIARYDTRAPLNGGASWQFFDLTRVSSLARGYQGGATNARFMYLAPTANLAINKPPPFLRWDGTMGFTDPAAWKPVVASTGAPPMTLMEAYGGYAYMSPYGIQGNSGKIHRIKMTGAT